MVTRDVLGAIPEEPTEATAVAADEAARPDRFRSSNGVVFKLKTVPPLLIIDAQKSIIEPTPPRVPNADKDGVIEDNPNDPTYLQAMYEYRAKVGEVANAILLTRGTELVSVPDDVDKVDDTAWSESITELTNIEVPAVGRRRYFCWVKYIGLPSMNDFEGILRKLARLGGVTLETEVSAAAENFRSDTPRDAATGLSTTTPNGFRPANQSADDDGGSGT